MTQDADRTRLNIDDTLYETEIPDSYGKIKWTIPDEKLLKAFIPGTVIELKTTLGTSVKKGEILLILDAMKMYNEITAPLDGIVAEIAVAAGDRVEKNQLLIRLS